MLTPNETLFSRIGLLALGLAQWPWAHTLLVMGALPRHPLAVVLVIALFATSFALVLAGLAETPPSRTVRWVIVSFALICFTATYASWIEKSATPTPRTTDGHIYMELAARMLLQGVNPYRESLLEAYRLFQMPLSYATPLVDGDVSDRVAYPAFSFLVLVPFVLLQVPTYLVYGGAYLLALGLVAWRSPPWARALVIALFAHDATIFKLGFDGVNDAVWVLFVVGAILCWSARPSLAYALIGLACAHKQQAWFLVPFLAVLLFREQRERLPRFVVIAVAVFCVINLPFLLWAPKAWLLGVAEPLVAPMITLSDGLSALTMTGLVVLSKPVLRGLFWLVYALTLVVYVRHTRALRHWCWMLPAVALWFSNRALLSYWYFAVLPSLASVIALAPSAPGASPPAPRAVRTIQLVVGVLALIVVGIVASALRGAPFDVERVGPIEVVGRRAVRLRLRVTNRLATSTRPRFMLQSNAVQPLSWKIDVGPSVLGPHDAAEYAISAVHGYAQFDATVGARLAVSADGDASRQTFLDLPGDHTLGVADEIPNGGFAYVDRRAGSPYGWAFHPEGEGVTLDVTREPPIHFRFAPVAEPALRRAEMTAILALPEVPIEAKVFVPAAANLPPWNELYGIRFEEGAVHAFVLLGEAGEGILPSGERFVSLPARRGAWDTIRFSPRELLAKLGAPLVRQRAPYERAPELDAPSTPIALGLHASIPDGRAADVSFGEIHTLPRSPDAIVRAGLADRAGLEAWHAAIDIEMRNHAKAATLLAAATAAQPTAERFFLLAEEQRQSDRASDAVGSYEHALALGFPRRADALRGLARVYARSGDCARARETARALRIETGEAIDERNPVPPEASAGKNFISE